MLRFTTRTAKRLLGRHSYHYAAARTVLGYRAPRMQLTVDGTARDGVWVVAAVANLESTAGQTVRMAPGARCDDGLLDLLLISDLPRLRRIGMLSRLAHGRHLELPGVELIQAREVMVSAAPAARLNIDGELMGSTPARFEVLAGAIQVRVPPAWATAVAR